ncbi:hypothetical protein BG015_005664 [Linnemannia schmuckeri]|uniref:Uncharacterized protein n=1 Tax=Linnemannia schmuckeri TaxID=64567 RepID=A0A9P5R4G9_9FUNG|nr:hypothetical protein BG015_005664 [Linnemannia schmuckeri]
MDLIRHFKFPYGTVGDLFDAASVEGVCKMYFEDMHFATWNYGRTVLIELNGYKERSDAVKEQSPQTYFAVKLQSGHVKQLTKDNANRPQANFLPQVPKRGTGYVLLQKPSKRIQKEKEEEAREKAGTAAVL